MAVLQFKIDNFRSIDTTGWLPLSPDGVTALVGQNESGKSSILDALALGFGLKAEINPDDFRIGNALPIIWLIVTLGEEDIKDLLATQHESIRNKVEAFLRKYEQRLVVRSKIILIGNKHLRNFSLSNQLKEELLRDVGVKQDKPPGEGVAVEDADKLDRFDYEAFREELWRSIPELLLFKEEKCPLPNRIDIVGDKLADIPGQPGAQNFIDAAGIRLEDVISADNRRRGAILGKANAELTKTLQKYWSQLLGKATKISLQCELQHYSATDGEKSGQPYLVFWVREGDQPLYPTQRSRGTRWFIAFFLQLIAEQKRFSPTLILLDEPASYLHQVAQSDVIRLIERLAVDTQVIYSTHSPYMLDQTKLHRILAVERAPCEDDSSETITKVHRGLELAAASELTLAPILALMGVDLTQQHVIRKRRNVILEEPSAYYYFKAFKELLGVGDEMHFVAASGADNVKTLVDLFLAWGLGFTVLVDDDQKGKRVTREIKAKYCFDDDVADRILQRISGREGVEDLFSIDDFSKHVLDGGLHTNHSNSAHVNKERLSKPMLAVSFWNKVQAKSITDSSVDAQTKAAFSSVFDAIAASFA